MDDHTGTDTPGTGSGTTEKGNGSGAWSDAGSGRVWLWAVAWALGLSAAWALLAWDLPAVPVPGASTPRFWLPWSPVAVAAILGFLAVTGRKAFVTRRPRRLAIPVFVLAGAAPFLVAALVGLSAGGRTGDAAALSSAHLAIFSAACLGIALTWGSPDVANDRFAALTKALEVLVAAAILFAILEIAGGLTLGIFSVLGLVTPGDVVQIGANLAFGVIPVLAVAAAYDPAADLSDQDLSRGPLRWLRLFARLAMVPALAIMAAYVIIFIPLFFVKAFQDRAVLLVYNGTIMAVLALLVLVLPAKGENLSQGFSRLLRRGMLALAGATFALNVYALAANAERVFRLGLTANRHVVLGWNLVTLLILGMILVGQARLGTLNESAWDFAFRRATALGMAVAAVWSLWVTLASPLLW